MSARREAVREELSHGPGIAVLVMHMPGGGRPCEMCASGDAFGG